MKRNKTPNPPTADRRERVQEILSALVDVLAPPTATWDWIHWSAWARTQDHGRRLAARDSIRTTKIGRDLFGFRADLDALAARNASTAKPDPVEDIDADVVAAFAGGAR